MTRGFTGIDAGWLIVGAVLMRATVVPAADDYFPPPESQGGWRKLERSEEIRQVARADPEKLSSIGGFSSMKMASASVGGQTRAASLTLQIQPGTKSVAAQGRSFLRR